MFHGPPPVKIKREPTPSKDLSPCCSPMPFREKCLYSYRWVLTPPRTFTGVFTTVSFIYSACDRKPTSGYKPETPPSTPVSPCVPSSTAHPLRERIPPPHPHVANPAAVHLRQPAGASSGSPEQPGQGHSPAFAVPCGSISQHASPLTPEHRYQCV